jgi:hypothetical protein
MKFDYCSMDGKPVLANDRAAYQFSDGKWTEIHATDALMNAAVIGEARFKERFGNLPQLPSAALQD